MQLSDVIRFERVTSEKYFIYPVEKDQLISPVMVSSNFQNMLSFHCYVL